MCKEIKNSRIDDDFLIRNIRADEAAQTAEIEAVCFPPEEALSEKMMSDRIAGAANYFLVAEDKVTGKPKVAEKHPSEKAIFMNMCMLCDGDMVLALDKTGSNYSGTTFPGGHVEAGETFSEAVIREMREETGLTIRQPVLKGIYHWYRDGLHNVGLLYRADSYEGELKSSEEGQVYWISREEYEKKDLAVGMRRVLQIMDDDNLTECFMDVRPDGSIQEHMF